MSIEIYNKSKKFFGESAEYIENSESEKIGAKLYLDLWKKFILRKLQKDCYDVKVIDEQWVERPAMYAGALAERATLALKLCIEADFYYEIGKNYK